jgi:hypothetical protein
MSLHTAFRSHARLALRPLAALCLVSIFSPALQAQSAYTATVLSSPDMPLDPPNRVDIDNSNRVHGNRSVFSLVHYFVKSLIGGTNGYVPRAAVWASSTGASVSPGNLSGLPHSSFEAITSSDNGAWTLLIDNKNFSAPTLHGNGSLSALSTDTQVSTRPQVVNDQGMVGGELIDHTGQTSTPFVWQSGVLTKLPTGTYRYGNVLALNNQGVAVGRLYDFQGGSVAARWVNGQLDFPAAATGAARSAALKVNDSGAIVLTLSGADPAQADYRVAVLQPDGRLTTLQSQHGVVVNDFNNDGVVAGCTADEQATLWKDGVAIDVMSLVVGKGAKLSSTNRLRCVWSINDSGSLVAWMMGSNGNSVVRFTAKP